MVPQGETVTLPAGSYGYITQALGGSYTVFVEGNLFRIAGKDGDAMAKAHSYATLYAELTRDQAMRTLRFWRMRRVAQAA